MQAFERGEKIEFKSSSGNWLPLGTHNSYAHWNWEDFDYRIKPETPAKHPYTQESWGFEWVKTHNGFAGEHRRVLAIYLRGILIATEKENILINWAELMSNWLGSNDRVNWVELYR